MELVNGISFQERNYNRQRLKMKLLGADVINPDDSWLERGLKKMVGFFGHRLYDENPNNMRITRTKI